MICILALVVFGTLSIFSARHRPLAKEAFDCVFRKLTLRKCESGLDLRLKSQLTGKLLRRHPRFAKIIYKNFELLSLAFTLLFLISFVYMGIGGYNYYLYGDCNGPNESGFCIFDPLGSNEKTSSLETGEACPSNSPSPKYLTLANVNLDIFPTYDRGAENDVIFIGCYACPYTREAYPQIQKLLLRDDVNFVFAHFPIKGKNDHLSDILNAIYLIDKQKFITLNDALFELDPLLLKDEDVIMQLVEEIGMDSELVQASIITNNVSAITAAQAIELQKTGLYGTPTVFVNGNAVVGPKPYRVYTRLLK
ncbi:MAG: thioredoxin domain-containing protein [Candidatus Altiarchaeota archaeon]|nr:thioredoxin domain-containing protein [Candidatus Altiarchaeota archaeon]